MFLPLLLGMGVLLVSVSLFAMGITLVVMLMGHELHTGYAGQSPWKNVALMTVITLVMAIAHLCEIALWAAAFWAIGEIESFDKAFYLSAQNYTALGYGDIVLSERWRLLGPLEAINGLLLFGLSTAAMFAALSRLVSGRLHS
jgi:hypothetical protein